MAKRMNWQPRQKAAECISRAKVHFGLTRASSGRKLDIYSSLPSQLQIPEFGDHMSMFGMHEKDHRPAKYRRLWFRPAVTLLLLSFQVVRCLFWLATSSKADKEFMIKTGDLYGLVDNGGGSRHFQYLAVISLASFSIYSLLTNRKFGPFHWYGIPEVLRGEAPPIECKLDRADLAFWQKLVGHVRMVIAYTKFNSEISLTNSLITFTAIAYMNMNWNNFLIYGIPGVIICSIWTDTIIQIYIWELCYFYIGCYYLKQRFEIIRLGFQEICTDFELKRKGRYIQSLVKLTRDLNLAQSDLMECNTRLGHHLPIGMLTLTISFLSWFYVILFLKHSTFTLLIFLFGTYLSFSVLAGFVLSASMVTSAANHSYQTLLLLQRHCNRIYHKKRLMKSIESLAMTSNRIGFYCFTWFLITRKRFFDLCFIIGAYFLKMIDVTHGGSFI